MTPWRWWPTAAVAVLAALAGAGTALVACGSDGDATAAPTGPATSSTTSSVVARPPATGGDEGPAGGDGSEPDDDERPLRLLVLGDSLAAGALEATDLLDQLDDAGFDLVEVLAEPGEGLEWGIEVIEARAAVPEVVVVELGTNPSGDPTGFGPQVRRLLRALRARGAEHIAWLTLAHRDEGRYDDKNAILRRVDDIDLLADWAALAAEDPALVADGLHPSPAGYEVLAGFLVETAVAVAGR